jgi:hypothetical protein
MKRYLTGLAVAGVVAASAMFAADASANSFALSIGAPGVAVGYSNYGGYNYGGYVTTYPAPPYYYPPAPAYYGPTYYAPPVVTYSYGYRPWYHHHYYGHRHW